MPFLSCYVSLLVRWNRPDYSAYPTLYSNFHLDILLSYLRDLPKDIH
jgi:hypothetical protein